MRQTMTNNAARPADARASTTSASVEAEAGAGAGALVLGLPGLTPGPSPLDALVREGARKMLQAALESEVEAFLAQHAARVDNQGHRQVVRNGHLPAREIITGAGPLEVSQPRVRDKSPSILERVKFSSSILPPYLRKSQSIEELIFVPKNAEYYAGR